jgi:two-component system, cell cycle sensor histidine kinase and response regulator CckA
VTSLQISIVEDDAILCDLLTIRLTKLGYSINGMYASGEDAISGFKTHVPDVVLMDISLSGEMDGIEAANIIQESYDIPVVYLTGSTDSKTFERAMNTRECEYVIKPFTDNDLFIAIELAFHKHALNRKLRSRERCLMRLIGDLGDAVITTDAKGTIAMMNPAALALTGCSESGSRNLPLEKVLRFTDDSGRSVEDPIMRVKNEMDTLDIPGNISLLREDGSRVPVRGSVSPVRDEKGNFAGVVLTLAPLTREKVLRSI